MSEDGVEADRQQARSRTEKMMAERLGKRLGIITVLLMLALLAAVFYVAAQSIYIPGSSQSSVPIQADNYGESGGVRLPLA